MTIAEQILDYAIRQRKPFRRRDLMQALGTNNVSEASAHVLLNRLVKQGKLVKAGYGLYSFPEKSKQPFVYKPSEEEQTLAKQIKDKFPFADFCVWKPRVLVPYMLHVPLLRMTFIDVERVAMESVFHFLQGNTPAMSILLNPTAQECERYITTDELMIVRALVNEAPITNVADTPVPTLEKILVDAAGDRELNFAQGSELYTIFENAFSMHNINTSRLLRYAARRNRKEYIQEIINSIELWYIQIADPLEWIEKVAKENHVKDIALAEKAIRAFSLLEALVRSGCPLLFKGGTAEMLHLNSSKRLSIDVDIICPPGTQIEDFLKVYSAEYGFGDVELVERVSRTDIPKKHAKYYYQVSYPAGGRQDKILLDVLFEDNHYT